MWCPTTRHRMLEPWLGHPECWNAKLMLHQIPSNKLCVPTLCKSCSRVPLVTLKVSRRLSLTLSLSLNPSPSLIPSPSLTPSLVLRVNKPSFSLHT